MNNSIKFCIENLLKEHQCLPVQSAPHVKQRRSIHANCVCILIRTKKIGEEIPQKNKKRIPHWRIHLRRNLVHKVRGQTQTKRGWRQNLVKLLFCFFLVLLLQIYTHLSSFLLLGCEAQWAPFPEYIRAKVMSQHLPPPTPPTQTHISIPTFPPITTTHSFSLHGISSLMSLCHQMFHPTSLRHHDAKGFCVKVWKMWLFPLMNAHSLRLVLPHVPLMGTSSDEAGWTNQAHFLLHSLNSLFIYFFLIHQVVVLVKKQNQYMPKA